ncbi:WxL domain-containing protein [Cytobacillus sp. Sa5YUA1]|uniref:WxL domain-containing protein n=1 Tax=Cytobacillus stercorigallinarum TaxID=2762240 RepID=A0ABR8QUJ8_9BACI|nr:WxL domain-containing protein [Cytobacillus stercorigallinarum]MBD7939173.1 WxL domain-containing protein [Cytobacillus stercorigallinarum]
MKFKFLGIAGVLLGGMFVSQTAFAAEVQEPFESPATVEFEMNTTNPNEPGGEKGEDGNNNDIIPTTQVGPLTVDVVPKAEFGLHTVPTQQETYEANNQLPYLQVTEQRGADSDGWNVAVKMTQGFTDGTNSFEGLLTFQNATVKSVGENSSNAPVASDITITDAAQNILSTQDAGDGLGTWLSTYYTENETNENISLTVPAGVSAGSYEAELEWTISSGPTE